MYHLRSFFQICTFVNIVECDVCSSERFHRFDIHLDSSGRALCATKPTPIQNHRHNQPSRGMPESLHRGRQLLHKYVSFRYYQVRSRLLADTVQIRSKLHHILGKKNPIYHFILFIYFINVLHAFIQRLKMSMFLLFNVTVDRHRQFKNKFCKFVLSHSRVILSHLEDKQSLKDRCHVSYLSIYSSLLTLIALAFSYKSVFCVTFFQIRCLHSI